MANGYTSHNGVDFPIVWLRKKHANGTKFTRDDCVAFAKAGNGGKPTISVAEKIAELETKLKEIDSDKKVEAITKNVLPGDIPADIDGSIKAGTVAGLIFKVSADERNIILQIDARCSYHHNLEAAMNYLMAAAQKKKIRDAGTIAEIAGLLKIVHEAKKEVELAWK